MAEPGTFILFAQPRSGGTSLTRSLNRHPSLHIAEEPFHERYGQWHREEGSYLDSITDTRSLEEALHRIFCRYNGMKVDDYQLPEEIYTHMLLLPEYKIILLRRRNMLRAVVSGLIAEQTAVWHVSDLTPERRASYAHLAPLSVEAVAERLEYVTHLRDYYQAIVSRRPEGRRLVLTYEDFYAGDVERNRASFREVLSFLGVDFPETMNVDYYLDPRRSRINGQRIYRSIPNAEAIDERFGSDRTGRLFDAEAGED